MLLLRRPLNQTLDRVIERGTHPIESQKRPGVQQARDGLDRLSELSGNTHNPNTPSSLTWTLSECDIAITTLIVRHRMFP